MTPSLTEVKHKKEAPLVVMLGYKSGSGKDTLAKYLTEFQQFTRVAFADKLKSAVGDLYAMSHEQLHGSLKNELDPRYNMTPREILQKFGQDQRAVDPDIWAAYVMGTTIPKHQLDATKNRFVITDFRFPNEHSCVERTCMINGWRLVTVKINRPEFTENFPGKDNISETALDGWNKWDFELNNTGTPDELYQEFFVKYQLHNVLRRDMLNTSTTGV